MAGPWITFAELKGELAARLRQPPQTLDPSWDPIVARAITRGTSDVLNGISNRGFTDAQIDAADDIRQWAADQAMYWCLVGGQGLHPFEMPFIESFDHREEFKALVNIRIGGKAVAPGVGASEIGGISSG